MTASSMALLVFTILLFLSGYVLSPQDHYVSFSDSFHVGIETRGFDSRILFFNDAEYGPYRGSIIGIVGSDGNLHPPLEREEGFGDAWGVYYRYFQWTDGTLWTVMASLWYPIVLCAIVPTSRLWYWIGKKDTQAPPE